MRYFIFAAISLLALPSLANEVFVACGYGGRRMISEDGGKSWEITAEWIQPGEDDKHNLMGLVFAEGKFVCVGGGGGGKTGGGHILTSTDGREWRTVLEASRRVNPIVYGGGRFIVGGPERQQLMWSEDGENWQKGGLIEGSKASHWRHAAYGNGIFVFTGNNGGSSPPWVVTSRDGTTIDSFYEGVPSIRGITFGNGRFVIVGMDGVRRSSSDGVTWVNHDEPDAKITWVVWTGKKFLAGTRPVTESADGRVWTEAPDLNVNGVKWSDGERFICTGWPGKMSYSVDGGKSVSNANALTENGINKVVRGEVK